MAKVIAEIQCDKKMCGSLFSRNLTLDGIPAKAERCQECLNAEVKEVFTIPDKECG